ncbi:MAG: hypothetical protein IKZ09_11635, partial [Clostridia bacterium]|nr:hypothetical protein [Clostridia bacterium]
MERLLSFRLVCENNSCRFASFARFTFRENRYKKRKSKRSFFFYGEASDGISKLCSIYSISSEVGMVI